VRYISSFFSSHANPRNGSHCSLQVKRVLPLYFIEFEERIVIMKFGNGEGRVYLRRIMTVSLYGNFKLTLDSGEALLAPVSSGTSATTAFHHKLSVLQFLRRPTYKPMVRAILIVMLAQQLSGINAVIFYSTPILSAILPSSSALISLIISLVNLATTIPSASLIERHGRKPLLLWSLCSMGTSSLFLGFGILYSWRLVSVISSLAFVAGFSFGLGPIPFLIVSEFVDAEAVTAGQSFGLMTNWIATFCVVSPMEILPSDNRVISFQS